MFAIGEAVRPETASRKGSIHQKRIIASIARVEFASELWRKHRAGELDAADAALLERALEARQTRNLSNFRNGK